jgi:hypothetical protein
MKNLKANQRNRLIYEFGLLMQPFEELSEKTSAPKLDDYRKAIAKVQAGDNLHIPDDSGHRFRSKAATHSD